jgi:two-component system chemotaxis response regulator CheY
MSNKKVLIIDDSVTIRSMVGIAFKHMEWEHESAKSGEEALDKLESGDVFDFFVVDINMPGINGIELIEKMRAKPAYRKTPMLVLTTEGGDAIKKQGRDVGASGWMVKPFKPEVMQAAVERLCKNIH